MFLPRLLLSIYAILILMAFPPLYLGAKPADTFTLDSLINKARQPHHDLASFEHTFQNLAQKITHQTPKTLDIIHKVLLAEKYAHQYDAKNNQSTQLFEEAIALAEETKDKNLIAWANNSFGFYYYSYSQLTKALPLFLKVSKILDDPQTELLIQPCEVYVKSAYYFGNIDDPQRAITYLSKALPYAPLNTNTEATIRYAIGAYYLQENDLDHAEKHLIEARDLSLKIHDELRYAKALGDLASIYEKRGLNELAETMLLEDIAISERLDEQRNKMYAEIQLAKIYLKSNKITEASTTIHKAYTFAKSKSYLKGYEQESIEIKLQIAQLTGSEKDELHALRELNILKPQVSIADGENALSKINWELQKKEVITQLEIEKAKVERATIIRLSWTAISLLLIVVVILLFFTYRRKLKLQTSEFNRKVLSIQMDKLNSEKKLKETNNSLASFKLFLQERNLQIQNLEKELSGAKKYNAIRGQDHHYTLSKLLDSHLMTDDNWARFKTSFEEELPSYYQLVINSLPDLTESNLRILLLTKLGLNNTQIAHTLGVTVDAIKKAKQRLRKKYGPISHQFFQ